MRSNPVWPTTEYQLTQPGMLLSTVQGMLLLLSILATASALARSG